MLPGTIMTGPVLDLGGVVGPSDIGYPSGIVGNARTRLACIETNCPPLNDYLIGSTESSKMTERPWTMQQQQHGEQVQVGR